MIKNSKLGGTINMNREEWVLKIRSRQTKGKILRFGKNNYNKSLRKVQEIYINIHRL